MLGQVDAGSGADAAVRGHPPGRRHDVRLRDAAQCHDLGAASGLAEIVDAHNLAGGADPTPPAVAAAALSAWPDQQQ